MWDQAPDAEHSVIGAMLVDPQAIPPALGLTAEDFTIPLLGTAFRAIAGLHAAGVPVDLVTADKAAGELVDAGQRQALTGLLIACGTSLPTTANVAAYVAIVAEKAARRRAYKLGEGIMQAAQREQVSLPRIQARALEQVSGLLPAQQGGEETDAAHIVMAGVEYAVRQGQKDARANLTGIADLDRAMGGLHPGEVTILAARPKTGKSTLGWQIADSFAQRGQRVMFVSREMPHEQLAVRWFAQYGVDAGKIRHGAMGDDDWAKLADLQPRLMQLPLHAHTRLWTPTEISAQVAAYKRTGGLGLLVIDYIGLLRSGQRTQNANAEISAISLAIKGLALEHKVPVLCLSQLSRAPERRENKFPGLADLRDSGSIEQDADNVLFLFAPQDEKDVPTMDRELYRQAGRDGNHLTYLEIAKQRQGPQGRFRLIFRPALMRMYSYRYDFVPGGYAQEVFA